VCQAAGKSSIDHLPFFFVLLSQFEGITLIEVPYWWDNTKDSLMATIKQHREELAPDADGFPIPRENPSRKG
jgi:hypothetical protein